MNKNVLSVLLVLWILKKVKKNKKTKSNKLFKKRLGPFVPVKNYKVADAYLFIQLIFPAFSPWEEVT